MAILPFLPFRFVPEKNCFKKKKPEKKKAGGKRPDKNKKETE
jgi:hypothetical protein